MAKKRAAKKPARRPAKKRTTGKGPAAAAGYETAAGFRVHDAELQRIPRRQLVPDPLNPRVHTALQRSALTAALAELGFVGAVLVRPLGDGRFGILDGHERAERFEPDELVPCLVVELSAEQARQVLATFDQVGSLAEIDADTMAQLTEGLRFDSEDLAALVQNTLEGLELPEAPEASAVVNRPNAEPPEADDDQPAEIPEGKAEAYRAEARKRWQVRRGQLFEITSPDGERVHRLLCGDGTREDHVAKVTGGERPDMAVLAPPYCSGGYQEAGRRAGSMGRRAADEAVANDTLSTRGFQALVRGLLHALRPPVAYVFTDWRQWVPLFDVLEGCGLGVRQMVVWDKGSPGLGNGWRAQHELVAVAVGRRNPFDPKKASGNVVQAKRTGNVFHSTEKPVELVRLLIETTARAATVADTCTGSGTTLVAAELAGRTGWGVELTAGHTAVALQRMADAGCTVKRRKA